MFIAAVPNFTIVATGQGYSGICSVFKLGTNYQSTLNQIISVSPYTAYVVTLSDDGMWLGIAYHSFNEIVNILRIIYTV